MGSIPGDEKKAHKYTCIVRSALWTRNKRMSCILADDICIFDICFFFSKTPHKLTLFFTLPVLPHQSTSWPFGLTRGNLDQDHLLPSQPEEQSSQLDTQAGKQAKTHSAVSPSSSNYWLLLEDSRPSVPLTGVPCVTFHRRCFLDLWFVSFVLTCELRGGGGLPSKYATPFQPRWLMARIFIQL